MQVRSVVALLALAGVGVAHADTVFSVTASYDPFISGTTTFVIDNLSSGTLTDILISGNDSLGLSNSIATEPLGAGIAPNGSETFTFQDLSGGPFQQEAGNAGVPDSATYQISADLGGQTIRSNVFSPANNASGSYVDFLGNCFVAQNCSDTGPLPPQTGLVADGGTPVPLPPAFGFLATGLVTFAARLRRRVQVR